MTVAAVSVEAGALGIRPGMALTQARAMVPDLDVRDAEPDADADVLNQLGLFAARRWTPRAAVSDETGLWLDLSGVAHLFGGERHMCERIVGFCARLGFSAHIAVAGTPGAAHALARYGSESILLCRSGKEAEAIASLPLAALRIEERTLGTAKRLGIERIGEIIAMPRAPLTRRFGKDLLNRLDQALGRVREPFDPIVPEETPQAELRLVEPIATAEAIDSVLAELLKLLADRLQHQRLGVRKAVLVCFRVDGEEQVIAAGTARATRDPAHLHRLLAMKIEEIDPGFGIETMRLVALWCEPLEAEAIGSGLADVGKAPDLAPLADRLVGRLGPRRLFRMSAIESDVPERCVRRVSPLEQVKDWPRDWPRPVHLLSRPERIDKVMAELPDAAPIRFAWRGRTHIVRQADGPERIYGEWWKRRSEAEAVRDYFRVEDQDGRRFWLFRRGDGADPRTGDLAWYVHGIFG